MLSLLFTKRLEKSDVPVAWENAVLKLINKKGKHSNYRPMSIISVILKIFKVLMTRLESAMDSTQPREQQEFLSSFRTVIIFKQLGNSLKNISNVNYLSFLFLLIHEIRFDWIHTSAAVDFLQDISIGKPYINIIEIYKKTTEPSICIKGKAWTSLKDL